MRFCILIAALLLLLVSSCKKSVEKEFYYVFDQKIEKNQLSNDSDIDSLFVEELVKLHTLTATSGDFNFDYRLIISPSKKPTSVYSLDYLEDSLILSVKQVESERALNSGKVMLDTIIRTKPDAIPIEIFENLMDVNFLVTCDVADGEFIFMEEMKNNEMNVRLWLSPSVCKYTNFQEVKSLIDKLEGISGL